jgi:hypothetical protein
MYYMNRRGTEPYARWCGRMAGAILPPTRSLLSFPRTRPELVEGNGNPGSRIEYQESICEILVTSDEILC